jgi:hypothetical protein
LALFGVFGELRPLHSRDVAAPLPFLLDEIDENIIRHRIIEDKVRARLKDS